MEYIVITLAGLALAAAFFYAATHNVGWTLPKALFLLFGGVSVAGAAGFLLWLTPFPFPGTAAVGIGAIAAIVAFAANLKVVPPAETWFFVPALFRDSNSPFDVYECHEATSGLNLVLEGSLETFFAAIPMGRVVLDGPANLSDPPKGAPGVIEVRCRDGSEAYIPIRIESEPLFADPEALGRFIRTGTTSGAATVDHGARLAVVLDRWQSVIAGPLEAIAATLLPSQITRNVIQAALEAPAPGLADAHGNPISYLDLIRAETWVMGMNPWLPSRENPQGLIARVGDIRFSDEAEETLASKAVNAMIGETADAIFARLAPTSAEDEMSYLLYEQIQETEALKEEAPADLDVERAKLLAAQRKDAARRKRILEARKKDLPAPDAYASSLKGNQNAAKLASDYRASYEGILIDLAEAAEDEASDELLGDFKAKYLAAKKEADEKKAAIKKMEVASASGTLIGKFEERHAAHVKHLADLRSVAYRLASVGEDANADYLVFDGLGGGTGDQLEALRAVAAMAEAREAKAAASNGKKGGAK